MWRVSPGPPEIPASVSAQGCRFCARFMGGFLPRVWAGSPTGTPKKKEHPMVAVVRPAATVAAAVVALTPVVAVAPSALLANPPGLPMSSAVTAQEVVLTGFIADIYNSIQPAVADVVSTIAALVGQVPIIGPPIADQINILYTYGEAAVAATVYWVDDLVTPIATGNFWPLSGNPGNYIAGAIDSTVIWVNGLIAAAIGFVNAEINFFTGLIPNIPSIPNIINDVVNTVQNVINWIIGWIPGPFAAVEAPSAAASVAVSAVAPQSAPADSPASPAPTVEAGSAPDDAAAGDSGPAEVSGDAEAAAVVSAVEPAADAAPASGEATRRALRSATAAGADAPAAASAQSRGQAGKAGASRAGRGGAGEPREAGSATEPAA